MFGTPSTQPFLKVDKRFRNYPNTIGVNQVDVDGGLSRTPLTIVSREINWVTVTAKPTNLAAIYVAGETVVDGLGVPLYALGSPMTFQIDNLNKIYFVGSVGDGVIYTYGYYDTPSSGGGGEEIDGALLGVDGSFLTGVDGTTLGGV